VGRSVREIRLLAGRSLRRTLRNRSVVLAYLVQPLVYLFIFTRVFQSVGSAPIFRMLGFRSYLTFFLPGLLVISVLAPAVNSGLALVIDLQMGTLDGFLRTPIRRWSIVGGKIASDAIRMLIQATVVVGLSIPLGARLSDPARAAAALLLIVGLGMAVAGLSNVIALRTRSAEVISALANLVLLPFMFLTTAYMPRTLLPRWLQLAASANPLTYVIEGARRLLTGASDTPHVDLLIGIAIVAALAWIGVAGSTRAFRKATA